MVGPEVRFLLKVIHHSCCFSDAIIWVSHGAGLSGLVSLWLSVTLLRDLALTNQPSRYWWILIPFL